LTNLSISFSSNLPFSLVIVIDYDFPVDFSQALIFIIPLASTSKVTSIYGVPLGAGGIPSRLNLPSKLLSLVIFLSPSNT